MAEIEVCNEVFMHAIADIEFGRTEDGSPTKVVYPPEVARSVF